MKSKKKKIILAVFIVLMLSGYSVYRYMYKEHRNIASENIDFELKPTDLQKTMKNATDVTLVDKVIQTQGIITSIEQNSVTLNNMVQVNFNIYNVSALSLDAEITIKGRCVGYDDLLELVKIDQATLINN